MNINSIELHRAADNIEGSSKAYDLAANYQMAAAMHAEMLRLRSLAYRAEVAESGVTIEDYDLSLHPDERSEPHCPVCGSTTLTQTNPRSDTHVCACGEGAVHFVV
jgi:hypothetical protein